MNGGGDFKTPDRDDQPTDSDDDEAANDVPAYYIRSRKRRNDRAKNKTELAEILEGHGRMFQGLTASMTQIAERFAGPQAAAAHPDPIDLWSQMLADKVRTTMNGHVGTRFQIHVDKLALSAAEDGWIPPV